MRGLFILKRKGEKEMKKYVHAGIMAVGMTVLGAVSSFATTPFIDVSGIDLTEGLAFYGTLVVAVYTALAMIWPARKGIKLFNRS